MDKVLPHPQSHCKLEASVSLVTSHREASSTWDLGRVPPGGSVLSAAQASMAFCGSCMW